MDTANVSKTAARLSHPPPDNLSESGMRRINLDALNRALADSTVTWSEIEAAFGVGPTDKDEDT